MDHCARGSLSIAPLCAMVLSALHSTGTVRGDDANLLLRARRLARLRDAIVRDYVEWLTRYEVPGGEVTVQQAAQYFGFLAKVRATSNLQSRDAMARLRGQPKPSCGR